jgi:3-dehydroquinate synthase
MTCSATLANNDKFISDSEHRRLLNLFSRAGLSIDHHQFDESLLAKATAAILKTRDGLLRAAVPNPIGSCTFLNNVLAEEMNAALRRHKALMKEYPRNGEGIEVFVDASNTGYSENAKPEEIAAVCSVVVDQFSVISDHPDLSTNGIAVSNVKVNGENQQREENRILRLMGVFPVGLSRLMEYADRYSVWSLVYQNARISTVTYSHIR